MATVNAAKTATGLAIENAIAIAIGSAIDCGCWSIEGGWMAGRHSMATHSLSLIESVKPKFN